MKCDKLEFVNDVESSEWDKNCFILFKITSLQPPHCQLLGLLARTRLSQEQSVSSPREQAFVTE